MCTILDTDRKQIFVPRTHQDKLNKINWMAQEYGAKGETFTPQTYAGYIDNIWKECIADTDKHLVTAQKRAKKWNYGKQNNTGESRANDKALQEIW